MRILIVDHSKAMRMVVRRTLEQAGFGDYEMIEASSGVEAFSMINSESPDLVLSDWNMPQMKGIQLLEKVRKSGSKVRFGFITSQSAINVAASLRNGSAVIMTCGKGKKPIAEEVGKL